MDGRDEVRRPFALRNNASSRSCQDQKSGEHDSGTIVVARPGFVIGLSVLLERARTKSRT